MSARVSLALSSSAHTRSASSLPTGKLLGGRKLTDTREQVGRPNTELEALPGRLIELRPLPGLLVELRPLPGLLAERGGDFEPAELRLMIEGCREGGGVVGGA